MSINTCYICCETSNPEQEYQYIDKVCINLECNMKFTFHKQCYDNLCSQWGNKCLICHHNFLDGEIHPEEDEQQEQDDYSDEIDTLNRGIDNQIEALARMREEIQDSNALRSKYIRFLKYIITAVFVLIACWTFGIIIIMIHGLIDDDMKEPSLNFFQNRRVELARFITGFVFYVTVALLIRKCLNDRIISASNNIDENMRRIIILSNMRNTYQNYQNELNNSNNRNNRNNEDIV